MPHHCLGLATGRWQWWVMIQFSSLTKLHLKKINGTLETIAKLSVLQKVQLQGRGRERASEVNYGHYCPLGLLLLPSCASPPALLLLPFLPCYWTRLLPCRVIIMLRGAMFTLHTRTAGDVVRSCYSLVAATCFSHLFSLLQNGS